MNLCVIPARGGSKRIPRKNIRPFRGMPMISWSINTAIKSECFDRIIVSTDDKEISEVAQSYGAEVPFLRPKSLADDYTVTRDVIEHAINQSSLLGIAYKAVCCLYATAPFVQPKHLKQALTMLFESNTATTVFPATTFPYPIQQALRLDSNGYCSSIDTSNANKRSQDLEEAFHDSGQFYWASPATWCIESNMFDGGRPLIIPRWLVNDIDTEEDWIRAELMHKTLFSD